MEAMKQMKEYDDTEQEETTTIEDLEALVAALVLRVANLETQRTPADANMDDPEWY